MDERELPYNDNSPHLTGPSSDDPSLGPLESFMSTLASVVQLCFISALYEEDLTSAVRGCCPFGCSFSVSFEES